MERANRGSGRKRRVGKEIEWTGHKMIISNINRKTEEDDHMTNS